MGSGDAAGAAPGVDPTTVVVVGGGIAGLSAALALTEASPALRVIVLEGDDRLGGKLLRAEIGGRPVDVGPDAFLARRPEAVGLCRTLGLGDELVAPGSRTAYVWVRGRLRALPGGLALGVPTRLGPLARSGVLTPLGLARAAVDLVGWTPAGRRTAPSPLPDRAVAAIVRPRLGDQVTDLLVDPLIGGIHAGDTARMSAAAVFPPLLEAAAQGGSLMRALRAGAPSAGGPAPGVAPGATTGVTVGAVAGTAAASSAGSEGPGGDRGGGPPVFLTVRGGLARLVDRSAEVLRARRAEVHTGWRVERLELGRGGEDGGPGVAPGATPGPWTVHVTSRQGPRALAADAVVVAVPAGAAAALLAPLDAALGRGLGAVAYADVTLVTLRLRRADVAHPLDGTGFLVPRRGGGLQRSGGGGLVTACTWLTSKWPELDRPGDVLVRASTGRIGDDRAGALSDTELVGRVTEELAPVLRVSGDPVDAVVTRWPGAFPQYAVGHLELVAAAESGAARLPSLALAGAALHGVGIPACIGSGQRAARAVLDGLAQRRMVAS